MDIDPDAWGPDEPIREPGKLDFSGSFGQGTKGVARARLEGVFQKLHDHQEAQLKREIERAKKPVWKTFSTQYAVDWGKRQGWRLRDRERYDARTKRHHDLMLGVDCLFETPQGLVGLQAAGKHERAKHYKRFEDSGGVEAAKRNHIGVRYLVFERGNPEPIENETWA